MLNDLTDEQLQDVADRLREKDAVVDDIITLKKQMAVLTELVLVLAKKINAQS